MTTTSASVSRKDISKMSKDAQDQIMRHNAKVAAQADIKSEAKPDDKPAPAVKVPKEKPAYLLFLSKLLEEGKFTQKELSALAVKEFPTVAKSTIETVLVDGKNPKYNRFPKLVVKDDKGLLKFAV
jgi:hypothetical protein